MALGGIKFWLLCFLAVWPWASCLTPLSFSFCTCEVRVASGLLGGWSKVRGGKDPEAWRWWFPWLSITAVSRVPTWGCKPRGPLETYAVSPCRGSWQEGEGQGGGRQSLLCQPLGAGPKLGRCECHKERDEECLGVGWAPCCPPRFVLHEKWVENYFGSFPERLGRQGPVHGGERFLHTPGMWSWIYFRTEWNLKTPSSWQLLGAVKVAKPAPENDFLWV